MKYILWAIRWVNFSILLVGFSYSLLGFAIAVDDRNASAHLEIKIEEYGISQQPLNLSGSIVWNIPVGTKEACFSLPFNSSEYGWNHNLSKHHELLGQRPVKPIYLGGSTAVKVLGSGLVREDLAPFLIRVKANTPTQDLSSVAFEFQSYLPWLPNGDNSDWFYDQFYPTLLKECPSAAVSLRYYREDAETHFTANIESPDEWLMAGAGILSQTPKATGKNLAILDQKSHDFSFALVKGYEKIDLDAGGARVHLLFKSTLMTSLQETIKDTLDFYVELLGEFPQKDLWIVESSELHRQDYAGLIAINTPRQAAFSVLQSKYLNWSHWNLVSLLAQQWMGVAIRPETADYFWILNGFTEFASLEALRRNNKRFNLINIFDIGYAGVSLNYLEVENLTAAILNKNDANYRLTDQNFVAAQSFQRQNPLDFVKFGVALRHLKSRFGAKDFSRILKVFVKKNRGLSIDAKEMFDALTDVASPLSPLERVEFKNILSQWLQTPGWPEVSLEGQSSELLADGRWITKVKVKHNDGFYFAVPVNLRDDEGVEYVAYTNAAMIDGHEADQSVEILSRGKPQEIVVDNDQSFFDSNRFNNRQGWPSVQFFPGNATTFSDHAYTVVWVPYPMRRPGQGFSLGIQGGIFKFLNGQTTARIERELKTGKNAWSIATTQELNGRRIVGDLQAQQTLKDFRLVEAGAQGTLNKNWHQRINLRAGPRYRDIINDANTRRGSVFASLSISPRDRYEACSYVGRTELENSFEQGSRKPAYMRGFVSVNVSCQATDIAEAQLRVFGGALDYVNQNTPEYALFDPQEGREARLRLDMKTGLHQRLSSWSLDLLFPVRLGIPDTFMILSRRIKMRAFYDYGQSFDAQKTRYRASGTGFFVPFGGDLSGIGSLALTQLSVLAVLYSQSGDTTSYRPRFLIDLSGQL